jgi:hypothetical protein
MRTQAMSNWVDNDHRREIIFLQLFDLSEQSLREVVAG